jgi:AAA15 family ATPase/GTPase
MGMKYSLSMFLFGENKSNEANMKITNVKLHNFRGVLEQEMAFLPYTVLVGPNNAGKSTFIDAIRAFYEKDGFKFKPDNDFPFSHDVVDHESWIEITFLLSDEEHESLADSYQTDQKILRVRKYFQTSSQTHKPGIIYGYNTEGVLDTDAFYGAKNVQAGKFGDIVYIPAVSKVDEHTKLSGPSALRDLVMDVMADAMAGEAYQQFGHAVNSFSTAIMAEKTKDSRSLTGFEQTLNELLKPWDTVFKFQFQVPSAQDIVKQMVEWNLLDNSFDKPQDVQYFGSGFQRHFIYSLIQIGSQYVGKREAKKNERFYSFDDHDFI